MTWFNLRGDSRLGRCDTEGCGGQPTFRLEAGGVGSNYCSGCKAKIEHDTNNDGIESRSGYYGCSLPPGGCGCPQPSRGKCRHAHWVHGETSSVTQTDEKASI